jgi:mono/diheme cytochrome c family protein
LNTVGIGDNRWGFSYTQAGSKGLIANVGYMTNTGPTEAAFDSDIDSGGEGQSYVGSLQYLWPNSRFSGGIAAMAGTFPLPSGAKDSYNRQMALVSYTGARVIVTAMGLIGHDNNPNDGATPAAASNGWSFETIYRPLSWLHLNLRYDRTNDGLGTITNAYIADAAFSIVPNLVLTVENVSSVGARPLINYQLMWVGPWIRRPNRSFAPAAGAAASAAASPQPAASGPAQRAGDKLYAANCASCHGANGQGGAGPSLHGIAGRMTEEQTVGFIENPTPGGAMPKLYPSPLSADDVKAISAYIRDSFK